MRIAALFLAFLAACPIAARAEPVIASTDGDGALVVVLPDAGNALPMPQFDLVGGFPVGARPHGAGYVSDTEALVADFGTPRLFRVSATLGTVLATIDVPSRTNGNGTVAISPDGNAAIFAGNVGAVPNQQSQVAVIRAPFIAGATQNALALPGNVRGFNTQAVAFDAAGRAFICHTAGVSVVDPPYSTVAFTMAATRPNGSNCALRRDGGRLVVTDNVGSVSLAIYDAPFTAASVPLLVPAPAGVGFLSALGPSPDGTALLVAQLDRPTGTVTERARLFIVRETIAPPGVTWDEIALPAALQGNNCVGTSTACPGFEDMAVNQAGTVAIVTGNSVPANGRAPLLVVRNPFDDATRETFAVTVGDPASNTHGRGAGSVRFLPPGLPMLRDGFE